MSSTNTRTQDLVGLTFRTLNGNADEQLSGSELGLTTPLMGDTDCNGGFSRSELASIFAAAPVDTLQRYRAATLATIQEHRAAGSYTSEETEQRLSLAGRLRLAAATTFSIGCAGLIPVGLLLGPLALLFLAIIAALTIGLVAGAEVAQGDAHRWVSRAEHAALTEQRSELRNVIRSVPTPGPAPQAPTSLSGVRSRASI